MIAGQLEIQMSANLARLSKDMQDANRMVGGAMRDVTRAVGMAKSALGALGIGLSVGYFAHLVKSSIDAAGRLDDLNKTTGVAIEQLAGLRLAATQSGSDLTSIAAAISKLSVEMGRDAEKFARIGITAKEPIEAFKQLSDLFVKIRDPEQRAAVMAEALGKSWGGAAPLLAEGGKHMGEMIARGTELSGVTHELVAQSDAFGDKLDELTTTGGLLTRQVAPLLPILNAMADDLLALQTSAYGTSEAFNPLAESFRAILILGGNVAFTFKAIGNDLGGMAAQMNAIAHGDFKEAGAMHRMMIEDAEASRKAFDAWEQKMLTVGLTATKVATVSAAATEKISAAQIKALHDFSTTEKKLSSAKKNKLGFDPEADFWFAVDEAGLKNRKDARDKALEETEAKTIKMAHDITEAQKREHEELNRSLTDALLRGFESGKGFAQVFVDTVQNMFSTLILRPVISAIISPVSGAISAGVGSLGFSGAAGAATGSAAASGGIGAALGITTAGGALSTPAIMALHVAVPIAAAYVIAKYGFGMGNSRELVGGNRLVGNFNRAGFSGGMEQSWKQSGGWFGSDDTGVYKTALTTAQGRAFQATVTGLQSTFDALGSSIGDLSIHTRAWNVEVNQAGDVTGLLADGIAMQLLPQLEAFRLEGETLAKTAQRLTGLFATTNSFILALGLSSTDAFGAIGIASAEARQKLTDLAGGADAFSQKAGAFIQNFLTGAQQLQPALDAVGRTFSELGISGIETNAQFADLVKLNLQLGHYNTVDKLLNVSDAFNTVTRAAKQTTDQLLALISTNSFKTMVDYQRAIGRARAADSAGAGTIAGATATASGTLSGEAAAALAAWEKVKAEALVAAIQLGNVVVSSGRGRIVTAKDRADATGYTTGRGGVRTPSPQNAYLDAMAYYASLDALLDEMRAMRAAAEATAATSKKTADLLRNVTQDGQSLQTTAA